MRDLFESLLPRSEARPVPVQLEDYLDHLCAPLIDRVTYEQRLAIREEVRSHILVLSAGHEELGSSPEEALKAAMQQFGDARRIGRSLLSEYRQPFTLTGPLFWYLLHGVIGGVVGVIAFVTMDAMLQHKQLVSYNTLLPDCLVGFALGFLPGVHLMRRPASPWKAGLKTAGVYIAGIIGILFLGGGLRKGILHGPHLQMVFTAISGMGIRGLVGGAVMSPLFRRLQRFTTPRRSKPEIAS